MEKQANYIPKYERIKNSILEDIQRGVLKAGDKLPVRTQLVKQYHVTRTTVDKALNKLIDGNVLVASRRRGTFVASSWKHVKNIALVFRERSVMQHSYLFEEQVAYYSMFGALLSLLKGRRCEIIDTAKALKSPEILKQFDVILVAPHTQDELKILFQNMDEKKVVLLNRHSKNYRSVSTDHYKATKNITELMLSKAQTGTVYFIGSDNDWVVNERRNGFIDACEKHKRFYRLIKSNLKNINDWANKGVKEIKISAGEPLLIISSTSMVTGAVMRYATENGLKFNTDFFYADFDNINPIATTGYPITSIHQNFPEIARVVMRNVDGDNAEWQEYVPYKIINNPFK